MTGVALDCLDITAIQLQLIGDTGMTKTVKYDSRKIILLNQSTEGSIDGASVGMPRGPAMTRSKS